MDWINDLPEWVTQITLLVTALTGVTALLPNKSANRFFQGVYNMLNVLAGNVLRNKNRED